MGFLKFVASLTGTSSSKAAHAGHDMRSHSGARSGRDRSSFRSAPSWASKGTKSGIPFFPKGKRWPVCLAVSPVCSRTGHHFFDYMREIPKNLKNKICVVIYDDAVYFKTNVNPQKPPRQVVSVGEIRRVTDDFVDLAFYKRSGNFSKGIIIPISTIISCEELHLSWKR